MSMKCQNLKKNIVLAAAVIARQNIEDHVINLNNNL